MHLLLVVIESAVNLPSKVITISFELSSTDFDTVLESLVTYTFLNVAAISRPPLFFNLRDLRAISLSSVPTVSFEIANLPISYEVFSPNL
jgi:hypothetical protein